MNSSAVIVVCFFLVQMAYSQTINRGQVGTVGASLNSLGGVTSPLGVSEVASITQLPVGGPYGGTGTGEISVSGDVQAAGQTVVTGQVPVIGTVSFSGSIPAGGVVSISGNCGCGALPQ